MPVRSPSLEIHSDCASAGAPPRMVAHARFAATIRDTPLSSSPPAAAQWVDARRDVKAPEVVCSSLPRRSPGASARSQSCARHPYFEARASCSSSSRTRTSAASRASSKSVPLGSSSLKDSGSASDGASTHPVPRAQTHASHAFWVEQLVHHCDVHAAKLACLGVQVSAERRPSNTAMEGSGTE